MMGKRIDLVRQNGMPMAGPALWGVAYRVDGDSLWVPVLKVADESRALCAGEAVLVAIRSLGYVAAQVTVLVIDGTEEVGEGDEAAGNGGVWG